MKFPSLIAVSLSLVSAASQAALVTIDFEAHLPLGSALNDQYWGDTASGSFTFDTNAPLLNSTVFATGQTNFYSMALVNFELLTSNSEGASLSVSWSGLSGGISVTDRTAGGDSFYGVLTSSDNVTSNIPSSPTLERVELVFDYDFSLYSSADLPTDVSSFPVQPLFGQGIDLTFTDGSNVSYQEVTSFTAGEYSPVPLPAAAWFFLSALGGLGLARSRR